MEIKIKALTKEYGEFVALDAVDISMESGMYGLLGANGAGKTTLIKILAGVLGATSGEIIIDGEKILHTRQLREIVGYIPQKFSFYPQMTVFETMAYFAALNKIRTHKKEKIERILEMTHLLDKKTVRISKLSGGMKQRLGIAVALIKEPKLLVVDEPTVGLDPKERIHFSNVLATFSKDRVILMSSHIVSDIESTCENLAILNYGNVIYNGEKYGLIEECAGKVWEFVADMDDSIELEEKFSVSAKNLYNGKALLRVVSEVKPDNNATNVPPNLNDAYLYRLDKED